MVKTWKIFSVLIICFVFFFSVKTTSAAFYKINNFHSNIELSQDRTLNITEEIDVDFTSPQHGIYRYLPYIYKQKDKTVFSKITMLGVIDQNGNDNNN